MAQNKTSKRLTDLLQIATMVVVLVMFADYETTRKQENGSTFSLENSASAQQSPRARVVVTDSIRFQGLRMLSTVGALR